MAIFSEVKYIFFDLDDTVLASRKALIKGIKRAVGVMAPKIGISEEEAYNVFIRDVLPYVSAIIRHEPFDAFAYQLGIKNESIIEEGFNLFQEEMDNIKPYDDVIPVLYILKDEGYIMGVISNGFPRTQFRKIWRAGLAHFFEERVYLPQSISPPYYKPTKHLFTYALNSAGAEPPISLMVGDRDLDIIGANLAGMHTCALIREDNTHFKDDESFKPSKPDARIKNLWELLPLLDIERESNSYED
ncbi:MAG: hypothetical protein DRH44_02485 [Candidatus Coatesbacteria bacterium]|nr:MAG: hypothetical protein DRH44_02485 [Candidatus Coatesbacteria bacterium]